MHPLRGIKHMDTKNRPIKVLSLPFDFYKNIGKQLRGCATCVGCMMMVCFWKWGWNVTLWSKWGVNRCPLMFEVRSTCIDKTNHCFFQIDVEIILIGCQGRVRHNQMKTKVTMWWCDIYFLDFWNIWMFLYFLSI